MTIKAVRVESSRTEPNRTTDLSADIRGSVRDFLKLAVRGSVRFAFFLAQNSYTSKLMNKNNKRINLISNKVIIFFIAEQKVLRKANEIFNYSSIEGLFE